MATGSADLLRLIFGCLGPAELLAVASTCRLWRRLGSANALWRGFCLEKWPSTQWLPVTIQSRLKRYYVARHRALRLAGEPPHENRRGLVETRRDRVLFSIEVDVFGSRAFSSCLAGCSVGCSRVGKTLTTPVHLFSFSTLDRIDLGQRLRLELVAGRECDGRVACLLRTDRSSFGFGPENSLSISFTGDLRVRRGIYKRFVLRLECRRRDCVNGDYSVEATRVMLSMYQGMGGVIRAGGLSPVWRACNFDMADLAWH